MPFLLDYNYISLSITVPYDWSLLNLRDIRDKYTLTLRNIFDELQEISETLTLNDKYENFINAHIEVAAECKPSKQRAKPSVQWETLAIIKKCADIKTASLCNINAQKLKAQNELTHIYLKEQTEYIQNQINKIRDLVEDRQSRIAWQTVNEVRRKSTARAKPQATAKKNKYACGNNISRIYLENLLKLQMNLSQKLLVINET